MLKRINEGFDNKFQPLAEEQLTDSAKLKKLLTATAKSMLAMGETNLKRYEIEFQADIERMFPDMLWWEVTNCNIFMELFNTKDPLAVVDSIIDNLTDEFKVGGLNDTLSNAVNQANTAAKDLVNEIDNGKLESEKRIRPAKKGLKESPSYDMRPEFDARKSFYGKARVDDNNGELTLYSYNTPVAKIANGQVTLMDKWDSSATTLRHIKEFLKQNGFEATSLAQIRKTYL